MWFRLCVVVLSVTLAVSTAQARTYAAIVQDFQTGEVLHSRSADKLIYPASLTKMMTLYMLFEAIERGELSMNSKLKVSHRAAGMPASKIWLKAGETIRVEDAIKALAIKSANDVAVVVAEALAASEIQFAVAMTAKARKLGMTKTTFKNASGLPNRRQKSTARDMATLSTRLLMDFPKHYHFFSQSKFSYRGKTYRSHNGLLGSYAGADGLKTGYIRASGFNLAASAKRQGSRLIAVVIGGRKASTRDAEMVRLLDLGFERLRRSEPMIAVGPPKARPDRVDVTAAEVQPEAGLASNETLADVGSLQPKPEQLQAKINMDVIDALLNAPSSRTSETSDLPVVHAPQRGPVVQAPNRSDTARRVALGLSQGPAKLSAKGRYGVQVGAYHDPDKARAHAHRVAGKLPDILLQGDIDVSGLSRGRRTVYRSRVIGFEKAVAERACARLRELKQECLVIRTDNLQLAASNQ